MKTLELTTGYDMAAKCSTFQFKIEENKAVKVQVTKNKGNSPAKPKIKWFAADSPENLTVNEAVIRGLMVYTIPVLSAVDWNGGIHTMFFIAPVIFYLEFTAFSMFCPIKAWFNNYSE